jgi:hypothetical protein
MTRVRTMLSAAGICAAAFSILPALADDPPGAKPGDDAMTCAQIAAELQPYAQQMMGTVAPLNQSVAEVEARSARRMAEGTPEAVAVTGAATASTLDPTGMSSRAVGQAEIALQQRAWNQAMVEDKPLHEKLNAQMNATAAQGMQMQANLRLQRLMQLAQEKGCH